MWVSKQRTSRLAFLPLSDTWRSDRDPDLRAVPRGSLLDYLNPVRTDGDADPGGAGGSGRRVKERDDLQQLLLPLARPGTEGRTFTR